MNAYIDTLLDKKGKKFYPKTKTSAVYDDDNNTLDSIIANKLDKYASGSSDWDTAPTQDSTKAVTSGGIYQAIDNSTSNKLDKYTSGSSDWDTAPTQNSTKAVTSGGVYQAIDDVKDDLGDPSSASAVTGDDAFSKISKLNSDLANKGTFAHRGIYAGYVTASKNYINFFVPMDLAHGASNPSVNVAITSLSAYIGTSRLSFAGYFDTSYISVNAYKYGITVEIKFLSTYSVEAPVSVYADLNITVS